LRIYDETVKQCTNENQRQMGLNVTWQ